MRIRYLIAATASLVVTLRPALPAGAGAPCCLRGAAASRRRRRLDTANGAYGKRPPGHYRTNCRVTEPPRGRGHVGVEHGGRGKHDRGVRPGQRPGSGGRVKGCAVKDTNSPSQASQGGAGEHRRLPGPREGRERRLDLDAVSGRFLMPFCGDPAPAGGDYDGRFDVRADPHVLEGRRHDRLSRHRRIRRTARFSQVGRALSPGSPVPRGRSDSWQCDLARPTRLPGSGTSTYGPGIFGSPEPNPKAVRLRHRPAAGAAAPGHRGHRRGRVRALPGRPAIEGNRQHRHLRHRRREHRGHPTCDEPGNHARLRAREPDSADDLRHHAVRADADADEGQLELLAEPEPISGRTVMPAAAAARRSRARPGPSTC